MSFSVSRSAMEGFRLVGRRPVSFLIWALLFGLIFGGSIVAFAWAFRDMFSLIAAKPRAVAEILQTLGRSAAIWLGASVVMIVMSAVLLAAIWRAALHPTMRSFAYMRLGGDELRLIGLQLLMFAILAMCEIGGVGGVMAIARSPLEPWAKILFGTLLGLSALALLVLVSVRLSLAGPRIVAHGRLDLGRSWAMTRRCFWPLLGLGVLAYVLAMAVSTLGQGLLQPFIMAAMGPAMFTEPFAAQQSAADPWAFITADPTPFVVMGVLAMPILALQMVVQSAPFAAAYRELSLSA